MKGYILTNFKNGSRPIGSFMDSFETGKNTDKPFLFTAV
ncbi:MAG: hypothetical protein AVDCRST_MAG95-3646 [uncultured Adhaeribacter sp.]|uniref:Uncharacterized protein n=1 Tax=uncultured Adhaeribacter sp. TaxID=448109 RepID=A0A6J4JSA0_9BACT|nr:MAG: hypothetical protein AVDCRST_MAG95-3646 [uncultured Adhaeribacter sp.]